MEIQIQMITGVLLVPVMFWAVLMTRCRACACVSMFANVVQHLKCDQQRRGADIVTRRVPLEDFPTFKFNIF